MDFNAGYETGNTDEMYGRDKLCAYVIIWVRRKIKFPYYFRTEHQQGYRNDLFKIECYDFEEVDYYKRLCKELSRYLALIEIIYPEDMKDDIVNRIDGGPSLLVDLSSSYREGIDGKDFDLNKKIRASYIAKPFSRL